MTQLVKTLCSKVRESSGCGNGDFALRSKFHEWFDGGEKAVPVNHDDALGGGGVLSGLAAKTAARRKPGSKPRRGKAT